MTDSSLKPLTKTRLVNISIDHFVKFGYGSAPLSKIAEEAGLNKSSIYHHFESKIDIAKYILKYLEGYYEKNLFFIVKKHGISDEGRVEEFIQALKEMLVDIRLAIIPIFMLENIPELNQQVHCHKERWVLTMKLLLSPLYTSYLAEKLSRNAWNLIIGACMEARAESSEHHEYFASEFEASLKRMWLSEV